MLLRSAEELEGYSRGEEARIEEVVKAIADSGAKVVAAGGSFGEMALHFLDKHGLLAVKIPSKFDLRRFCRATGERSGAFALDGAPRLGAAAAAVACPWAGRCSALCAVVGLRAEPR